jgi:predicted nucleic acid-binding protein
VTEKALPRIYADANMIIELGKKGRGWHTPHRADDIWFFEQILRASDDEVLEVYTSSISLSECTHIKDISDPNNHKVVFDKEVQEFFRNLLCSGNLIKLVQDSVFVAEAGRDLLWKHDLRLSGMDAIHVASAIDARCTEFLTWDKHMNDPNDAQRVATFQKIGIRAILPSQSEILPSQYRQAKLTGLHPAP